MEKTIIKAEVKGNDGPKIKMEGDIRMLLTLITTMLHTLYKEKEIKKEDVEMVCRLATSTGDEIRNEVSNILYDKLMGQFLEKNNISPEDLKKYMEEEVEKLDESKIDELLNKKN